MPANPSLPILTPQNVVIEYELASLGERILARLIDSAIQIGLTYAFSELIFRSYSYTDSRLMFIFQFTVYIFIMLYPFLFELLNNGQTVGKWLMRIKVVKIDGSQPGLSSYLFRALFQLIDFLPFLGIAGIICIALTKYSQRIGDLLAGTAVIRLQYKAKFEDTIFRSLQENYVPIFHQVLSLKDRDINVIDEVLRQRKHNDHFERVQKTAKKVKKVLQIDSDLPSEEFLIRIIQDYNHLTGREMD